jgi:hypothetical protein
MCTLKEFILIEWVVGYFMTLSVAGLYSVNGRMTDEFENNLEGSFHSLIELLSWNLPGVAEEKCCETSVRIAGLLA